MPCCVRTRFPHVEPVSGEAIGDADPCRVVLLVALDAEELVGLKQRGEHARSGLQVERIGVRRCRRPLWLRAGEGRLEAGVLAEAADLVEADRDVSVKEAGVDSALQERPLCSNCNDDALNDLTRPGDAIESNEPISAAGGTQARTNPLLAGHHSSSPIRNSCIGPRLRLAVAWARKPVGQRTREGFRPLMIIAMEVMR